MAHGYCKITLCLAAAGLAAACGEVDTATYVTDGVGLTTAALSVCEETVPANRNVDGIPSYAQCAESMDSAIYSNNGVDTSTTQMGSNWVRTQWSGGYQCTELANRYLRFRWGVKWIPNGNAGNWCDTQPPASSGVEQTMTPVHGDIMVLAPGSCGADQGTGHVTVVDEVNDTKLVVVEQNGARRGNYNLSCAKCFLHVMANDGVPKPADGISVAGASAPSAPNAPDTRPSPGAAGAPAVPPETPGRARPTAAGAPALAPPVAGTARAPMIPAAAPVVQPAPVAAPSTPAIATAQQPSLAAGSGAVATTRSAPPEASACSVAVVGSDRQQATLTTWLLGLAACVMLRRGRRAPTTRGPKPLSAA